MPITNTLENARKLEGAGLPARQAAAVSQGIENAVRDGRPDLSHLVATLFTTDDLRAEMRELELRIAERLRSQMLWFFALLAQVIHHRGKSIKILFSE